MRRIYMYKGVSVVNSLYSIEISEKVHVKFV